MKIKEYRVLRMVNGILVENGLHFNTLEQLRADFPLERDWLVIDPLNIPADFTVDTYTIQNGELVKASAEIIAKREAANKAIADAAEIEKLRAYLTQTDYAAIKCGELGLSMAEVYPELHTARTKARERINELQEGGAE